MKIIKAEFKTSVASKEKLLYGTVPEIALLGRSNVGKSSFINGITMQSHLAKTSSTPGRTRLVNYFLINDSFYFVDLPGYGYAQAGKQHKELWATLMEDYLVNSQNLKLCILLVDVRHTPSEQDKQMTQFLYYNQIPFKIVATKCDKVAKSKLNNYLGEISKTLAVGVNDIMSWSTEHNTGKDKILTTLDNFV